MIILTVLTFTQAIFLMFTYQYKTITYMISCIIYAISICKLSYFCCILNQFINISLIWFLLLEVLWYQIDRWPSNLKLGYTRYIWAVKAFIKCRPSSLALSACTSILLPIRSSSKSHTRYSMKRICPFRKCPAGTTHRESMIDFISGK